MAWCEEGHRLPSTRQHTCVCCCVLCILPLIKYAQFTFRFCPKHKTKESPIMLAQEAYFEYTNHYIAVALQKTNASKGEGDFPGVTWVNRHWANQEDFCLGNLHPSLDLKVTSPEYTSGALRFDVVVQYTRVQRKWLGFLKRRDKGVLDDAVEESWIVTFWPPVLNFHVDLFCYVIQRAINLRRFNARTCT
jgi:hypothetical protein